MKGRGLGVGGSPPGHRHWARLSTLPHVALLAKATGTAAPGHAHVLPRLRQPPGRGLQRRRAHATAVFQALVPLPAELYEYCSKAVPSISTSFQGAPNLLHIRFHLTIPLNYLNSPSRKQSPSIIAPSSVAPVEFGTCKSARLLCVRAERRVLPAPAWPWATSAAAVAAKEPKRSIGAGVPLPTLLQALPPLSLPPVLPAVPALQFTRDV